MASKILVVDDEIHIRRLIQINLERAGYEAIIAKDGIEALEMVATENPDLIILDWMMPLLNGIETLRRLKENSATQDIPVVMLTAKSSDEDIFKGWQKGADCYLTKPFNPMELLVFIKRILETKDDDYQEEDQKIYEI